MGAIFLVSLLYRLYGLSTNNPPFWVDEFASANQGKLLFQQGFGVFFNPNTVLEHYNITTHLLIAASYKFFGVNEFAARFPPVVIGSFIPVAVFYLARHLTNISTSISASLLVAFSYFEITWSRQARGYIIVQFLVLLGFLLYLKLVDIKKPNIILSVIFFLTIFLGVITHPLYYIFLISLAFHFLLTNHKRVIELLKKPWLYLLASFLFLIIYKIGFINALIRMFNSGTFLTDNFWYYHPFLWREYGLVSFLAILGFLFLFFKKNKMILPILIYIGVHLIFITFIFKPYVSRYLLPVFPFFIIGTSYLLSEVSKILSNHLGADRAKLVFTLGLTFFIIVNGHKFVNKPKKYYSLNHDFREIANIDYHQVYNIIKKNSEIDNNKLVIIETWWDRAHWYLGDDFKNIVAFRWLDEGFVNGISKKINYFVNEKGEKILKGDSLHLVLEKKDLQLYMERYPRGFIFIDDSSLPNDVIKFAEKNLKKELYLDHYPFDDNPYSIWPATLYSWGI